MRGHCCSGSGRLDAGGWSRAGDARCKIPTLRKRGTRKSRRRKLGAAQLRLAALFGGEFGAGVGQFLFVFEDALADFRGKVTRLAKRVRSGTAGHGVSPFRCVCTFGHEISRGGAYKRKKATSLWPCTSSAPNCLAGPPAEDPYIPQSSVNVN